MNHSRLTVALTLFLSVLPGCGPPPKGPWITKLSALPPPVRQSLIDSFRPSADYLRENPGYPDRKDEEIITDIPGKFSGGCIVPEGFADHRFVRAREAAGFWVIEYQTGGPALSTDVGVIPPGSAGILSRRQSQDAARWNSIGADATVSELLGRAKPQP